MRLMTIFYVLVCVAMSTERLFTVGQLRDTTNAAANHVCVVLGDELKKTSDMLTAVSAKLVEALDENAIAQTKLSALRAERNRLWARLEPVFDNYDVAIGNREAMIDELRINLKRVANDLIHERNARNELETQLRDLMEPKPGVAQVVANRGDEALVKSRKIVSVVDSDPEIAKLVAHLKATH